MNIVRDKLVIGRLQMSSAVGNQSVILLWDYIVGSDGEYWFWPLEYDENGAMIHCGSKLLAGRPKSEGFGGRTLDFPTKDGVIQIQGPWHTNSDALFERTGVDLRDKHRTWGVVSLGRGDENGTTVLFDLVYEDPDEKGVVGIFDRISLLAQQLSDGENIPLYYYRLSSGGSSCGPVYPSNWTDQQKREYHDGKTSRTRH